MKLIPIILIILSYFFIDKNIAIYFHTHQEYQNIAKFITQFGKAEYFLIPSFLIFLIFKNKKALFLFYSVLLSGVLAIIIKIIVARYRPTIFFSEHLYGFKGFDIGFLVNSFPSGHTTTAFSGFVMLGLFWPKYKYIFLFLAIIIGISRIILGVHYLSDVIAGAVLGSLVSYKIYQQREKLCKKWR